MMLLSLCCSLCVFLFLLKATLIADVDGNKDAAIKAIRKVYEKRAAGVARNCTPGAEDTVELLYDEKRWTNKARTAVFVANLITSVLSVMEDENSSVNQSTRFHSVYGPIDDRWLYDIVRNTVETDRDVIGSGICFGEYKYKNYQNFCPYASQPHDYDHSDHEKQVRVKDLSIPNYFYTDEKTEAEWWHGPKKKLKDRLEWQMSHVHFLNDHNVLSHVMQDFPVAKVEDGYWTKPYYDCGGAYHWMITYLAPFLSRVSHGSNTYRYIGVTSIDIDLSHIDINQCDTPLNANLTEEENVDALTDQFRGSHRCNSDTTFCQFIPGYGFRRGSYACMCKPGWYFEPSLKLDDIAIEFEGLWGFNGTFLEKEYDRTSGSTSHLFQHGSNAFRCQKCAAGCEECVDDRPCLFTPRYSLRGGVLSVTAIILIVILIMGAFVIHHRRKHIVTSAGTSCLIVALVGLLISCGSLYEATAEASDVTCLLQRWMFHIGTILYTGPLFLIAYRTAALREALQNKSPREPLKTISDKQLLIRLAIAVAFVIIYLSVWTGNDHVVLEETRYGILKVFVCRNSFLAVPMYSLQGFVLALGCYYGFKIRTMPSPFHENKRLFVTICNIVVMSFLFVLLEHVLTILGTNPDHVFVVKCAVLCANHGVILGLVYGTKVYAVVRGKAGEAYSRSRGSICSSMFRASSVVVGYFDQAVEQPQEKKVSEISSDNASRMNREEGTLPQGRNYQPTLPASLEQDEIEETEETASSPEYDELTRKSLEQERAVEKSNYKESSVDLCSYSNETSIDTNTKVNAHAVADTKVEFGRIKMTLGESVISKTRKVAVSTMDQLEHGKSSSLKRRVITKQYSMLRSFSQGDLLSTDISRQDSVLFESGATFDSCPSLIHPRFSTPFSKIVDYSTIRKSTSSQYLSLTDVENQQLQGISSTAALVEDYER